MSATGKSELAEEALFSRVLSDMQDMKASMSQMAEAITRLAVLEERHRGFVTMVEKSNERMDRLEGVVTDMRLQNADVTGQAKGVSWIMKGLWTIGGILATAVGYLIFAKGTPPVL